MTTNQCPINSIAIDVLGQYNDAAKHLVSAYRVGTRRTVAGVGERYERLLNGRSLVSDGTKERLIGAEQQLGNFVVGAVSRVSERADSALDLVASRAVAGIEFFGAKTAWTNDSAIFNALRTLNLPAAKLSLQLATKLADASRRLSERVAGEAEVAAPVAKATKTVKRAAKRTRRVVRKAA
jgi:hypothetical protein